LMKPTIIKERGKMSMRKVKK